MRRRALLGAVATGALSLAGCAAEPPGGGPTTTTSGESPTAPPEPLPESCPTTQDLDVEWPRELDESAVAAFVEAYEEQYYLQVVFEFDPASRYSRVGSAISRVKDVTAADGGWRVRFSGILGVNEAFLFLQAEPGEPTDDAAVFSSDRLEAERLRDLVDEAVDTGEADLEIGPSETDAYVDRFEAMAEGFEISDPERHDTLYVDVNGTTVELGVSVESYHADTFWDAWYYVDERVVWRSAEADTDPRDGALLECRTDG